MPWLMQARDSSTGNLVTWLSETGPDFDASDYPGPGNAQHVAVSMVFGEGGGGGGALPELGTETLLGRDQGDVGEITLGDGLEFTGDDEIQVADGGVALAKLENAAQYRVVGRVDSGSGSPTYLTPAQLISVLNQATSTSILLLGGNYTAVGDPTGGTVGMHCQLAPSTRVRNESVTDGNTLGLTAPGANVGVHLEVVFQVVVTTTDQEERLYFKTLRATAFRGASSEELTDVEITPIDDPYFDSTEHSVEVAVKIGRAHV